MTSLEFVGYKEQCAGSSSLDGIPRGNWIPPGIRIFGLAGCGEVGAGTWVSARVSDNLRGSTVRFGCPSIWLLESAVRFGGSLARSAPSFPVRFGVLEVAPMTSPGSLQLGVVVSFVGGMFRG